MNVDLWIVLACLLVAAGAIYLDVRSVRKRDREWLERMIDSAVTKILEEEESKDG